MAPQVRFKFLAGTSGDARESLIAELHKKGAQRVEALFPGDDDVELATLYSAHLTKPGHAKRVLDALHGSDHVEFAEAEPARRLIRTDRP
jgi:hypothetical protein